VRRKWLRESLVQPCPWEVESKKSPIRHAASKELKEKWHKVNKYLKFGRRPWICFRWCLGNQAVVLFSQNIDRHLLYWHNNIQCIWLETELTASNLYEKSSLDYSKWAYLLAYVLRNVSLFFPTFLSRSRRRSSPLPGNGGTRKYLKGGQEAKSTYIHWIWRIQWLGVLDSWHQIFIVHSCSQEPYYKS